MAGGPAPAPGPAGTRRRTVRRWFRDLRVSRKLMVVIAVHLLHAAVLLVVTAYGMKALSASRAYVEGEGLWSKAQKEGTLHLVAYADGDGEANYDLFLRDIDVTLGDRQARQELDKADPDMAIVRDGFLRGRLHPDDIEDVVWLYRNFGNEPHLAKAIAVWRAADVEIDALLATAQALRTAVQANDTAAVAALRAEVYASDARLTVLEDAFSRDLGNGVRWLTAVVTWGTVGLTVVFVGIALVISTATARQITRSLGRLSSAAQAVSAGDLAVRVGAEGRDDVAAVGRSFDAMADRLAQLVREGEARNADLAESLGRFQTLAEGSPLGIFHTDAQGAMDYANPRLIAIAGVTEAKEAAMWQAIHPEDVARVRQEWDSARTAGRALQTELRVVHPDKSILHVSLRALPMMDTGGTVTGFVGTAEDVTGAREAETARAKQQEQAHEIRRLEETNAFRAQFINTAAHELRTPLTPLRVQMSVLRRQRAAHATPEEKRSLDILERNVERMGALVEDMLQVARYQAGRLGIEPKAADLHAIVREAAESFGEAAKARHVRLEVTARGDGTGHFDPKRMSQVVYNLLSNAIKFTPGGGTVRAESSGDEEGMTFTVTDTGIGIRPEDLKRLFMPFSQVHREPTGQPGSGLGLYICRAIVELHGGTITASSQGPGTGVQMTVNIPRNAPRPPPGVDELAEGDANPRAETEGQEK